MRVWLGFCFLASPALADPVFTVVTSEAGLSEYVALRTLETGGAAWFDYDGDGWMDMFLTNGANQPKALFRNTGAGSFVQTSEEAGLGDTLSHDGFGVCWGDWDNDGDPELLLAGIPTLFFINNGDTTFSDATMLLPAAKGLAAQTGYCAFLDGDLDGDLDLVVGQDLGSIWYLENAGGAFGTVTTWPLGGQHTLALLPIDYDNDSDQDVIVVNDYVPDWLMRNDGSGVFVDASADSGFNSGNFKGCGMGIDASDLNGDGWFDYFVSDYYSNSALLISNGDGTFSDQNSLWGIETGDTVGWGVTFGDFDNNGFDDLFVSTSDELPTQRLYVNQASASFLLQLVNIDRLGGQGIGTLAADYDQDGDLDILEMHQFGVVTLLRNDSAPQNWLRVVPTCGNPLGVRVTITVGDQTWMREITGNVSQQSQGEPVAHFGLGAATIVDTLTVRWPNGEQDVEVDIPANQTVSFPCGGFPDPEPDAGVPDMGAADGDTPDSGALKDGGQVVFDEGVSPDAENVTMLDAASGCGCALGQSPKHREDQE